MGFVFLGYQKTDPPKKHGFGLQNPTQKTTGFRFTTPHTTCLGINYYFWAELRVKMLLWAELKVFDGVS